MPAAWSPALSPRRWPSSLAPRGDARTIGAAMTERKAHLDALAVVAVVFCCFLWGLNQVAAKAAMPEMPALWQAAARSVGGGDPGLALGDESRHAPVRARRARCPAACSPGRCSPPSSSASSSACSSRPRRAWSSFIYIAPFVVALGMPLIARSERLQRAADRSACVLAFAGVAWAFAEGFSDRTPAAKQWIGDALGVLAGVLWGATTLAIRATALEPGLGREDPALPARRLGAAAAGGGRACRARRCRAPLDPGLGALLFQVVIVTFASYLLWFWLIRHYPATRLASFTHADAGVRPAARRACCWPSR